MPNEVFTAKQGALFVQVKGANTTPQFLGCHDLEDLVEPGGAIDTLIRCFNPDGTGWRVIGSTTTPPDPVTTSITTFSGPTRDYLEQIEDEFTLFALQRNTGRADLFSNWNRAFVVGNARIGDRGATNIVRRNEDTESGLSFDISALPPVYRLFEIKALRQANSETESLNGVAFLDGCQEGYVVGDAAAGSPSNVADVLHTEDGGSTWTATSADPLAGGEDIAAVTVFPVSATLHRVLVARGTTDAGAAMEIAYSDSKGAAWTTVEVGSTNGQYAVGPRALYSLGRNAIWLVTDGGYIYKSEDGGASWTTQDAGVATSNDLTHVYFVNESIGWAAGASDTILKTTDGGITWSTVTPTGESAAITALYAHDADRAWVGAGGSLYYTTDGGTTWTERAGWSGSGTGTVKDVVFVTGGDLIGFMLHDNASPVGTLLRTIDGGYTWDPVSTPANTGLNSMVVCDANQAFVVGEDSGGTAVILKAAVVG